MDYLLKTEPSTYSFADLEKEKTTVWDGVSNPVALKYLRGLVPYDEEFAEQMEAAREIMRENRDVLKRLAE